MKNICVFGASCSRIDKKYFDCARRLGELLSKNGFGMVFGGGAIGLMGAAAQGAKSCGGRVVGVIPEKLNRPGIPFEDCDELIVTATMHERKAVMERMSAGFVALPGGFGTLEEIMEVLTLNQLSYIQAPVVLLDVDGFYAPLIRQFEVFCEQGFTRSACLALCIRVETPEQAIAALKDYKPPELPNKIEDALKDGN